MVDRLDSTDKNPMSLEKPRFGTNPAEQNAFRRDAARRTPQIPPGGAEKIEENVVEFPLTPEQQTIRDAENKSAQRALDKLNFSKKMLHSTTPADVLVAEETARQQAKAEAHKILPLNIPQAEPVETRTISRGKFLKIGAIAAGTVAVGGGFTLLKNIFGGQSSTSTETGNAQPTAISTEKSYTPVASTPLNVNTTQAGGVLEPVNTATPQPTEAPKPTATVETAKPEATVVAQIEKAREYFKSLDIEAVAKNGFYIADGKDTNYSSMILMKDGASYVHTTREEGTYGGVMYSVPKNEKFSDGTIKRIIKVCGTNLGVIDVPKKLRNGKNTSIQLLLVGISPTTNIEDRLILPVMVGLNNAKGDDKGYAAETNVYRVSFDIFKHTDRKNLSKSELSVSLSNTDDPSVIMQKLNGGKGQTIELSYGSGAVNLSGREVYQRYLDLYNTWVPAVGVNESIMNSNTDTFQEKAQKLLIQATFANAATIDADKSSVLAQNGVLAGSLMDLDASKIPWNTILQQQPADALESFGQALSVLAYGSDIRIITP
ncbi:hypothetical protein HGB07_03260 [Candidatus Roizmanbacteria bacterium]|nr:hypothetical protein [Candidatus Roizmanbacteria bacterium]